MGPILPRRYAKRALRPSFFVKLADAGMVA